MPLNTPDLYRLSIKEAEFTAYCGGNLGGDNETCVTVATIPGVTEAFVIRDNKPGATNVDLRFTGSEMDTWAIKWVRERGPDRLTWPSPQTAPRPPPKPWGAVPSPCGDRT